MMNEQQRLVVTGWSCISPYGIGAEAFRVGLALGAVPEADVLPLIADDETAPYPRARIAAGFDIGVELGKKGTRTLDRLTALSIATVGLALRDRATVAEEDRSRTSVVLGSSQGSLRSISGFTRETLRHERPDYVNPALFPNTVMNCAAGQTAIWHGCCGPNVTVSAGHLSAISAIRFSMIALRQGYADLVLAGGAEEFTGPNAWAHYLTNDEATRAHSPLAEGCAIFAIESAVTAVEKGRKAHAEILGAVLATYGIHASDAAMTDALATCIGNLLDKHSVTPDQIALVCKSALEPKLSDIEDTAIDQVLTGSTGVQRLGLNEVVGNAISASTAFQLAVLLTHLADGSHTGGAYALLVAIDSSGSLGAVLIRNVA